MIWIIQDKNINATKYYLDILDKSAVMAGHQVKQVKNIKCINNVSKDDFFITTTIPDAMKLFFKRKKKIIMWFQGAYAEESFMKHKSIIRKNLLERFEKYILSKSLLIFFVSEEMKKHYSNLSTANLDDKSYIMPCFNSTIKQESFYKDMKYDNNTFCYAGSLSIWQGFDKILDFYKEIEKINLPNTKLLILTKEKNRAKELIEKSEINNYDIDYVPLGDIDKALSSVKYGFILREDNIVNRVATPTKISTYMANGIIPIYSDSLSDFKNLAREKLEFAIEYNNDTFINDFNKYREVSTNKIYNEYSVIFNTYYSVEYHSNKISKLITNL